MGLQQCSWCHKVFPGSIVGTSLSESDTWVQACLFKNSSSCFWLTLKFHIFLLGSHSFHRGIFICGWMPNYYCWEGDTNKNILFGYLVDVTPVFFIFKNVSNMQFVKSALERGFLPFIWLSCDVYWIQIFSAMQSSMHLHLATK